MMDVFTSYAQYRVKATMASISIKKSVDQN